MAGKKILTQFVLPVTSSGGNMGNGTDGQALLSGGSSASMYWGSVPRIKTFDVFHDNTANSSAGVTFVGSDDNARIVHNLNTVNLFVSILDVNNHLQSGSNVYADVGASTDVLVEKIDANTIQLNWNSEPSDGDEFKVTIMG